MLDIDSGEQIEALYKLFRIKGGKKEEKFQTHDINEAIAFQKNYAARYREGLFMEILPKRKVYNLKEKRVEEVF
jgi:hypothetical protein